MSIVADQKAVIRGLRNYLAGQVVGLTRDETLLDELLKCAFCIRRSGLGLSYTPDLDDFYARTFEEIHSTFPGVFADGDRILISGEHLRHVHDALLQICFDDPQRDIVGDIYEAFIGSRYRGQEGQFFTPSNAVRALVELTDPTPDDSIIDPACGAGAFLLRAGLHASQKKGGFLPALHGADKDGYLARLARVHVALQFDRMFPVVCADSLAWQSPTMREWWIPTQRRRGRLRWS